MVKSSAGFRPSKSYSSSGMGHLLRVQPAVDDIGDTDVVSTLEKRNQGRIELAYLFLHVDRLLAILDLWGSHMLLRPEQPFHRHLCSIGAVQLFTGFQWDGKAAQLVHADPFDVPVFQWINDIFMGKVTDFDNACQREKSCTDGRLFPPVAQRVNVSDI